jgi:hypothetical protein
VPVPRVLSEHPRPGACPVIHAVLMVFMLPAGIVDGLLACAALVLLLTAHFGTRPLVTTAA